MKWEIKQRTPDERSRREFQHATLRLRFWKRIDVVLISGLLATLLFLIGGWFFFVTVGERMGWFDAPVMQDLADDRILTNVRTNLNAEKTILLDAIVHGPDEDVYISEQNGIIHHYDPRTHLWSTERPFPPDAPIDENFTMLRSGCGADLGSNNSTPCPDVQSIWAVGSDGSLARRAGSRWEIVLDNTTFIGADNQPVEQEALTTAAVSDDRQWLLLGTRNNGLGLYNLQARSWLTVSDEVQKMLPDLKITHLAWWRDRFWVGTPQGLAQVEINRDEPQITADEFVSGEVLDLDADPQGSLWVLEERACLEEGQSCLWLGAWDRPQDQPRAVIDQQNQYPDLTLSGLQFAQMADEELVLAGQAGIFRYDNQIHSWSRLSDQAVLATLPLAGNMGFYFAGQERLGLVEEGEIREEWDFAGGTPSKLLNGRSNELLIFNNDGGLHSLSTSTGELETVYDSGQTTLDPAQLTSATAIQDTILFFSPEGALLHNSETRSYADLKPIELTPWLLREDSRIITAGDDVYIVSGTSTDAAEVYAAPAAEMVDPDFYKQGYISELAPISIPGPVERIWPWGQDGLGLIGGDGSVYHLDANGENLVTGEPEPALNQATFLDVAQKGDMPVFVFEDTLRSYDFSARAWSAFPDPVAEEDDRIVEATNLDGQLLFRTAEGRLLLENGDVLIGAGQDIEIVDSALTDARLSGQSLFLAGTGQVQEYDFEQRGIVNSWDLDNSGDVLIKDIVNGSPLTLSEGQAALGQAALDLEAGTVEALSSGDDYIWTVRRDGATLYLQGHNKQRPQETVCLFRTPTAGSNTANIYDARELPNETVAVAGSAGLTFYSPQARTWYAAPDNVITADRLYRLQDSHLLLVEGLETGSDLQLMFIPLNFTLPHSCSQAAVNLRPENIISARAVTVDEDSGKAAWINAEGAVMSWENGQAMTVLGSGETPPAQESLRRLFDYSTAGFLLFATNDKLWRYDLGRREWSTITPTFDGTVDEPLDFNVERQGSQYTVTAQGDGGAIHVGQWMPDEATVEMVRVYKGAGESFGSPASTLLDVQSRTAGAENWTFVLRDGINYYDPADRTWEKVALETAGEITSFGETLGYRVLAGDNGRLWHIAQDIGDKPREFATYELTDSDQRLAIDSSAEIWRLAANGQLLRCTADESNYRCVPFRTPFYLEERAVRGAFSWQDRLILETVDGLQIFNEDSGEEQSIAAPASDFKDISAAFEHEGHLVLYSASDNNLLTFDSNLETRIYEQVQELLFDTHGRLWARLNNEWQTTERGAFEQPNTEITLFPRSGSLVTGIDEQGIPYRLSSNGSLRPGDTPFSDAIDPTEVDLLVEAGDAWWVLTGNEWLFTEKGSCGDPAEEPTTTETNTNTNTGSYECLQIISGRIPATEEVVSADWEEGRLTLLDESGRVIELSVAADGSIMRQELPDNVALPTLPREDSWPQKKANMVQLPSGQGAYDPVVNLVDRGGLLAVRAGGRTERLAAQGAIPSPGSEPFPLPPALNAGWLRWDRDNKNFIVNTNSGPQIYSRADFIKDGQLLFEGATSLLAYSENDLYAANRHGIWQFPQQDLALNAGRITYYPQVLPEDLRAVHGQFINGREAWAINSGSIISSAINDEKVTIGQATFSENTAAALVEAEVQIAGRPEDAFVSGGFIWDADRRGLAYDGSTLLLQSAAGIDPARQPFANFDPGPNELARRDAVLQSDGSGAAYLYDPPTGDWYQLDNGRWQNNVSDPHLNRDLLDNNDWSWRLNNGSLNIKLKQEAHNFDVLPGDFGFNMDKLRAGAAWGGDIFVATDAFLEIGGQVGDFQQWTARRLSPVETERMETYHFAGGNTELYNFAGGEIGQWNPSSDQFTTISGQADPAQTRDLVRSERLRFDLENGLVSKSVRVDVLNGGDDWETFAFIDKRFPFDVISAITLFDNALYLGTHAGLAVHNAPRQTGLSGLSSLYDLRSAPAGALAVVEDVGLPESNPNLLQVRAENRCLEKDLNSGFKDCADSRLLDRRLRLQSPFWQWVIVQGDGLIGQYRQADNKLDNTAIQVAQGRLPHDRFKDALICQGQAMSLWDDIWISAHPGPDLSIGDQVANYKFDDAVLERLICFEHSYELDRETIESGAYVADEDGKIWHFTGSEWRRITAGEVADGVKQLANNLPVFYRDRVRLLQPANSGEVFTFEQRALDGQWHDLAWSADPLGGWQVALDDWRQVAVINDQLWSATAAGLINVQRQGTTAVLDMDNLQIIREPGQEGDLCSVTDMMEKDGQTWVRCVASSSQVYQGALALQKDNGIFEPAADDPFAETMLVTDADSSYWNWQLTGRSGGQFGRLKGFLHGEEMNLSGGMFNFDTVNSLAFFQPDQVEIGTDSGGWFQGPRDGLPVSEVGRPQGSVEAGIDGVGITFTGSERFLCLRKTDGTFLRLAADGTQDGTENCPEYLGSDRMWRYESSEEQLNIEAQTTIGGKGVRLLAEGQFNDSIVRGLPVTAVSDGEINYLLPTNAGVMILDERLDEVALHAGSFAGLEEGQPPATLYMLDEETAVYLGEQDVYALDEARNLVEDSPLPTINDLQPRSLGAGYGDTIRLRWSTLEGQSGWISSDVLTGEQMPNGLRINVSGFEKFVENQVEWGAPAPWLTLQVRPDKIDFYFGSDQPYSIPLTEDFQLVDALLVDTRLLVIGRRHLLDINLESALSVIMEEA